MWDADPPPNGLDPAIWSSLQACRRVVRVYEQDTGWIPAADDATKRHRLEYGARAMSAVVQYEQQRRRRRAEREAAADPRFYRDSVYAAGAPVDGEWTQTDWDRYLPMERIIKPRSGRNWFVVAEAVIAGQLTADQVYGFILTGQLPAQSYRRPWRNDRAKAQTIGQKGGHEK